MGDAIRLDDEGGERVGIVSTGKVRFFRGIDTGGVWENDGRQPSGNLRDA